jgi:tRNA splicing endonuclease
MGFYEMRILVSRSSDTRCTFTTPTPQRRRCLVYADLIKRGYYITSGSKFGGDFLVYPGIARRMAEGGLRDVYHHR